jgi:hypothetical protein
MTLFNIKLLFFQIAACERMKAINGRHTERAASTPSGNAQKDFISLEKGDDDNNDQDVEFIDLESDDDRENQNDSNGENQNEPNNENQNDSNIENQNSPDRGDQNAVNYDSDIEVHK